MGREIKEGDVVGVPCRRCLKLSMTIVVRPGTVIEKCPLCQTQTRFHVTERELRVRSETAHQPGTC